MNGMLFEVYS